MTQTVCNLPSLTFHKKWSDLGSNDCLYMEAHEEHGGKNLYAGTPECHVES